VHRSQLTLSSFAALLVCCHVAAYGQQFAGSVANVPDSAHLTADQVAKNLEERNEQRAAALHEFSSRRVYRIQYHGFPGDRDAQMVVDVTYRAPNVKQFKIVSESGSTFVLDHIFRKLMESEQEFIEDQNREQNALTRENYQFTLAGYEVTSAGAEYVLDISPKKKAKFLYRGKIWVDAKDFAVVRLEAQPMQTPSIWIKKTKIEHRYEDVNGFWLPAADRTQSEIRLGGEANLSIDYQDYKILKAEPLPGMQRARADSH
jgi:outer membrane lipoprotein-sorting protein